MGVDEQHLFNGTVSETGNGQKKKGVVMVLITDLVSNYMVIPFQTIAAL